jgi:hypothetical protein
MPTDITPFAALVWFAVGFFTGTGWSLGAWVVARLLR